MFGIYLHIPFCAKKCDYCDFFSIPCDRPSLPEESYLRAIEGQLERDVAALGLKGRAVDTVYFGGGTPSLLTPAFFAKTLAAIRERFALSPGAEISCEANPGTVQGEWFREVRAAGVTRASIGVQTFHPELLEMLGRIHSPKDAMCAIAEAQDAGFQSVSLDLMYAIPGETQAMLEEDMRTAMMFQPEHLSAYQLTLEEGTLMYERYFSEPGTGNQGPGRDVPGSRSLVPVSEDVQLDQMRIVARMLSRGGWERYEISNFAKPGFECRHNLGYWRYGEYLGLGAGATSFIQERVGKTAEEGGTTLNARSTSHQSRVTNHGFARRWTQVRDVERYSMGVGELAEEETLDVRTAMAEYCFLGLRTSSGLIRARFAEVFGETFEERFGQVAAELASEGLLMEGEDAIKLTPRGLELSNQAFEHFLP
jgi:oxygen-independent coproporphyrinogen-3 oxidase